MIKLNKILKLDKNEIRVALFIAVPVAIVLLLVVLKLGYSLTGPTYDVYLKIDSISSVAKGTPVRVKGYEIGKIVSIEPQYKPALHFLAVMRITKSVDLYEDCSAVIQNQNILGDPVIELRNPEKRGAPLQPYDVIEGVEYVNLEAFMQDLHVLLTSISSTTDVIKQLTVDSRQNIKSMIGNLSGAIANINGILNNSQKDILEIISLFRKTAVTLNDVSDELKKHPMKFLLTGSDKK
ncbi:MAG: MlaD family protein [Spirochaetes bacterium]|jgi:ABC-type transporter Mla subunit MlaD|nr:MlaD family protein [Spirochaetota bacterium]